MSGRAPLAIACFVVGLLLGVLLPLDLGGRDGSAPAPPDGVSAAPSGAVTLQPPAGLPTVSLADLPSEAAITVALIEAGGPFPFRQDGATFENREGLLPDRQAGHYLEYTVPRPGNQGRGSLRIVAGADGELYWTADHYDSFAWIVR